MEKHKCIQTHKQLFDEFNKWKSLYKDVQAYINPYLGFFEDETPDSGLRKDEKIIRSSVVKYSHIYAAGLQWGITSPTRPWVKFTLPDDDVMQKDDVRFWLETVKNTTLEVLDRSNFYSQNHQNYLEMGCFGTGAMLIDEDPEDVIYCRTFTCGEYAIGTNHKGQQYVITPIVDTVTNTIQMALQSQNMSVLDKIDMDEVVDQIATANGVPPSIIVSDERVAQLRLQRQQAIQMQQQAEQSQQILQGVKDLSQSSLEGNNALSALLKGGEMQ